MDNNKTSLLRNIKVHVIRQKQAIRQYNKIWTK